jgi:crotonobetainyl-CoA:carnitine CoA-transferase CaiB-like acyl-CoA transferase
MTAKKFPLEDYVVLDLTRARAGPTAARVLADWGANVIHVEPPDRPGQKGGALAGDRDGFDFQNLHRNKRSLTIDLATEAGHALFLRLSARADVVVENFRADVKHRLKIDYEMLKTVNPSIIYGSIAGFGQTGPYKSRPGVDQIAQGLAGLMSITGTKETGPLRVGIPITDLCAGMFLAQGLLMALLDREKTGEGRWVHTSLTEAMVFMLDFQASRWLQKGEVAGSVGNDHPTLMPQSCYRTADKHINVAAANALYNRLCHAISMPHLAEHPDYITDELRSKNRGALNAEIEAVLMTKPSEYWINLLNEAGVPCGPVNEIDQVFADPQVEHLDMVRHVEHVRLGRLAVVRQPVNFSDIEQPDNFRLPAPDAGEHNIGVLEEFGLTADEIDELRVSGVV